MSQVKAYNGDMPYIFISYAHKDTEIVLQIVSQMQADGYRVWYDEGIRPGTEWDEYIASKVNKCTYFIAFLSENYLASSNCKDEINYARDHVNNILLVHLEQVNLPSGIEMRFGRTQAILAYNYASKGDFFHKLYLSKDIDSCKGNTAIEIVDESIDSISTEPYVAPSTAMPKADEQVRPEPTRTEPTKQAKIPEIEVERVPAPETKIANKRLMWIIIAAATVLVIALIVIGIVFASNNSSNKKSKDDKTSMIETKDNAINEDDEVKTSSVDNGYIEEVYSTYGISVGGFFNTKNDMDFYKNSGSPLYYDNEKEEYTDGTFSGVFAMTVQLPVISDYTEPLHIQWYHVESDGSELLVADFNDITPHLEEGVNWYELCLSALDLGGEFPLGDYYAVVYAGDNTDADLIIHVEYQ